LAIHRTPSLHACLITSKGQTPSGSNVSIRIGDVDATDANVLEKLHASHAAIVYFQPWMSFYPASSASPSFSQLRHVRARRGACVTHEPGRRCEHRRVRPTTTTPSYDYGRFPVSSSSAGPDVRRWRRRATVRNLQSHPVDVKIGHAPARARSSGSLRTEERSG